MPPAESPLWKPLAMSVISVLVGIGGAMVWSGEVHAANEVRDAAAMEIINLHTVALAVAASRQESHAEDHKQMEELLGEAVREMRAYHAAR